MAVSWGFVVWCLVAGAAEVHLMGAGSLAAHCVGGGLRGFNGEERPGSGRLRGNHTHVFPGTGALFVMQHNGWDHALKVTGDGEGLVGHAGAVLLRKAADQAGLTAGLSAALQRAG